MKRREPDPYPTHVRLTVCILALGVLSGCSTVPSASTTAAASTEPEKAAKAPAPPQPPSMKLPDGTILEARLEQSLSTRVNHAGDSFQASLAEPVTLGDRVVIARGARVQGHITTAHPSGRLEGRAVLGLTLDSIEVHGKRTPVSTNLDSKTSEAHKKRNIEVIGGVAGLGALIGGIVDGGRGAAIGAGAGAAAGTGAAAATGELHVDVPAETVFTFHLTRPAVLE